MCRCNGHGIKCGCSNRPAPRPRPAREHRFTTGDLITAVGVGPFRIDGLTWKITGAALIPAYVITDVGEHSSTYGEHGEIIDTPEDVQSYLIEPTLTQYDDEFRSLLSRETSKVVDLYHTGGNHWVARLSHTDRTGTCQVWVTREEKWYVGFYDFARDEEDEGACVELLLNEQDSNNRLVVANSIARILRGGKIC